MKPTSLPMGLLEKITNNFSEEQLLGQGGYGKVYKGVHDDGQEIAVKMLYNTIQTIDDVQFKREFENLMVLNHPNIVRLIAYCYETQHQYNSELQGGIIFTEEKHKALCFEYMPMGSLQNHLSDECSGLDWQTRYKIMKGSCEGLKYLHEGLEKPFYHMDIKPENILLDVNMYPKLADFGLSKFYSEDQTCRVTQSAIAGTFGYMPPEYLYGNVVSKKFDIFSLGVVMTKIIAGPGGHTRYAEMEYQEFLDQVQGNWRKRLQATLSSPEPLEAQCQQVRRCTEIALSCLDMDRHKRPSIADVTDELSKTGILIEKITYYEKDPSLPLASTSNVVPPATSPPPSTPSAPPASILTTIGSSTPHRHPPPEISSVILAPTPPNGGLMTLLRAYIYQKLKITERFTYRELASATRDFADKYKLRNRGYGDVYKDEARASFKEEINIMSPLNHCNITRLVGWCNQRKKLLLVYEQVDDYCNLEDRLYGHGANVDAERFGARPPGSSLDLDWRKRYNILLGIASGLEYLHTKCVKCIVHRDIKPCNVVLDRNLNAKLCDFGIAMQLTHDITSCETDNIIGTLGYMDPTYIRCGTVSRESDVYGFGVLLLEVVCGQNPIMIYNPPKNSLIEMVQECGRRNAIIDAADQRLRGEFDEEIKGALLIGLWCVEERRDERPTIQIVLSRLIGLAAKSTYDNRRSTELYHEV
ncbi:receptor like protein kinase S.2-like [Triticum dicoccoides]|uniref:receptor like protein kinase S.2-like n=1 Tax=Triticum dicoccoides TaxID=85692 RepID=UPI001890279C|nr:receptor like protein kinase S.2-like [Triticum dicoccoides]